MDIATVKTAIKDWIKKIGTGIIIGALAVGFYLRNYYESQPSRIKIVERTKIETKYYKLPNDLTDKEKLACAVSKINITAKMIDDEWMSICASDSCKESRQRFKLKDIPIPSKNSIYFMPSIQLQATNKNLVYGGTVVYSRRIFGNFTLVSGISIYNNLNIGLQSGAGYSW